MVSDKVVTDAGEQLRDYELVLIINPEIAEEQFEAAMENVNRFVTEKGGAVTDIERWGKKRLAYPIKHFNEGNYVLAKVQLEPSTGTELEASLQISEDILRYLLIKLDI